MRNYTAICSDGISTDVLSYPSMNDFKSKLPQLCGLYKTIVIKQNGNFICEYYHNKEYGVMKATIATANIRKRGKNDDQKRWSNLQT